MGRMAVLSGQQNGEFGMQMGMGCTNKGLEMSQLQTELLREVIIMNKPDGQEKDGVQPQSENTSPMSH